MFWLGRERSGFAGRVAHHLEHGRRIQARYLLDRWWWWFGGGFLRRGWFQFDCVLALCEFHYERCCCHSSFSENYVKIGRPGLGSVDWNNVRLLASFEREPQSKRCQAHQGHVQAAHPGGLGAHGAPWLTPLAWVRRDDHCVTLACKAPAVVVEDVSPTLAPCALAFSPPERTVRGRPLRFFLRV